MYVKKRFVKRLCRSILLTHQIPKQRLQLKPSEVGCGGQHQTRPIGNQAVSGQGDGMGRHGKEADEYGPQDEHDHQEDKEGCLGVDVSADQTHQQGDHAQGRGIEQRPPVARRQDLVGGGGHCRVWTWRVTKASRRKVLNDVCTMRSKKSYNMKYV